MDMSNYQGSTRSSPTRRHINDNPLLDWNHQRNEVTQHICYAFHISINNSVEFFWRNIPNLVIFINSTCIVYWIYIQVSSMGKAVSHYEGLKVKKKKKGQNQYSLIVAQAIIFLHQSVREHSRKCHFTTGTDTWCFESTYKHIQRVKSNWELTTILMHTQARVKYITSQKLVLIILNS